jgi:NAD+ synthase (glutamine-hydrolysing)
MSTVLVLHQTHHTLADFESIAATLKNSLKGNGLHLFPELFLTGYPLQDLCLQRAFIDSYHEHFNALDVWVKKCPKTDQWRGLVPGLLYDMAESGLPKKIENVVFEAVPGVGLQKIYTKRLLPNYDIFDEQKYFTPGTGNCFYDFQGNLFALHICEDMWASSFHKLDPCDLMYNEMEEKNLKVKMLINLSASPFDVSKKMKRFERAKSISLKFKCPFAYLNRVGGEDEILFDGSSFVVAGETVACAMKTFEEDLQEIDIDKIQGSYDREPVFHPENTWEGLFSPQLLTEKTPAVMKPWNDEECEDVLKALKFGLQEYARKSGFRKFLVALSGGMDSALVLAIVKLSLSPGQEVEAVYMPSIHSASLSTQLCEDMCRRIRVPLHHLPIKFLHATVKNTFTQTFPEKFEGLIDENVQSRLRGALLYTRSNQTGAMVINTSNKSELAVGYSTQYGDSVGAISLLGDLYKTEVYRLAQYVNEKYGEPIPPGIIDRGPSAELRQNQLDQDSLPPYPRLDPMLEGILSYRYGKKELSGLGFTGEEIMKTLNLYLKSEYKRAQFCPILKIKAKSFGFGYRIPISKNLKYHLS